MRANLLTLSLATLALVPGWTLAQATIYRCGSEYTNTVTEAQKPFCKVVEGGNLTVIQGTRPAAASSAPTASNNGANRVATTSPNATSRVDSADQRARDNDARRILESELRKAESRQQELEQEYKGGEPDKRGDEARNYQKYLDRVAELKASIARNQSDIAGIQREIARLPAAK